MFWNIEKMSVLEVSKEFLEENRNNLGQFMPKSHKRGPYSKQELEKRRNEVYRLHFDYGFSARKISDMMKINRNTINGDINYWYSRIVKNSNVFDPEYTVITNLQRLEIQRSRLRERLDESALSLQEKLGIERMILDVDSKILHTHIRLAESTKRTMKVSTNRLNSWLKKNNKTDRYMTLSDKISVSQRAREMIDKIIDEDRKQGRFL